jgi:hypothetical protein
MDTRFAFVTMGLFLAACGSSFTAGNASTTTTTGHGTTTSSTSGGHGGAGQGHGGQGTTTPGQGGVGHGGGVVTSPGGAGGSAPKAPCDGVQGGTEFLGHCYTVLDYNLSFTTAMSDCQNIVAGRKSYLVHVNDAIEEAFVETLVDKLKVGFEVWMGLECDVKAHPDVHDCVLLGIGPDPAPKEAAWWWIDDHASASYQHWAFNGPLDMSPTNDDRCATLNAPQPNLPWEWDVRDCTKLEVSVTDTRYMHAVCEIE